MPIPYADKKAFEKRFDIELRKARTLPDKTALDVKQILKQYRLEVNDVIQAAPTDWSVYHGEQVRTAIDGLTKDLDLVMGRRLSQGLDEAWEVGGGILEKSLVDMNLNVSLFGFSAEDLVISKDIAAGLVTDVSDSTREGIMREVQYSIMGGRPPSEAIRNIGQVIINDAARKGLPSSVFKSVTDRASFIVRTETGRVQNASLFAKTELIAEEEEGVRKYWIASYSSGRDHRSSHQSQDKQTNPKHGGTPIPYKRLFHLSSGQKARFPHDPRLSAKESVNCLCRLGTTMLDENELQEYYGDNARPPVVDTKKAAPKKVVPKKVTPKPTPQKKEVPDVKKYKNVNDFETTVKNEGIEHVGAFDKGGNEIFSKKGGKHNITFTKAELEKMRGATVTHNHPMGGSFSFSDYEMMTKGGLVEMRAVSGTSSFSFKNNMFGKSSADINKHLSTNKHEYNTEMNRLTKQITDKIKTGEIKATGFNAAKEAQAVQHKLWQSISKEYNIDYGVF